MRLLLMHIRNVTYVQFSCRNAFHPFRFISFHSSLLFFVFLLSVYFIYFFRFSYSISICFRTYRLMLEFWTRISMYFLFVICSFEVIAICQVSNRNLIFFCQRNGISYYALRFVCMLLIGIHWSRCHLVSEEMCKIVLKQATHTHKHTQTTHRENQWNKERTWWNILST